MRITRITFAFFLVVVSNVVVTAQTTETTLSQFFKGKNVTAKIDLPATKLGVDVVADKTSTLDKEKYQKRLATYGVAIANGQTVKITALEVNGREISFHLAGGGADDLDLEKVIGAKPAMSSPSIYESRTRARVGADQPAGDANALRSSLVYETHKRNENDAAYRAKYETRRLAAIENDRKLRVTMGSRFVIKLKGQAAAAITADMVKNILADYLDFSSMN